MYILNKMRNGRSIYGVTKDKMKSKIADFQNTSYTRQNLRHRKFFVISIKQNSVLLVQISLNQKHNESEITFLGNNRYSYRYVIVRFNNISIICNIIYKNGLKLNIRNIASKYICVMYYYHILNYLLPNE